MASLRLPSQLAHCLESSSSRSVNTTGRAVKLRRAFSPLLSREYKCRRRTPSEGSVFGRNWFLVHASTDAGANVDAVRDVNKENAKADAVELLACPVCFQALSRQGLPGLNQLAISGSGFRCARCQKPYSNKDVYLDLTILADAEEYSESMTVGSDLFRNPLVAFVYERGWRQSMESFGFPGPDKEVRMALEYLKPTFGGVLLDVSCGSGMYARQFANLDLFSAVVAIDYSEEMLRQTSEFIKKDKSLLDKSLALVRADVSRMPFTTGSIDAIVAGAALHCWQSPSAAMAECSRILRPGGVFVGTTNFDEGAPIAFKIFTAFIPGAAPRGSWKAEELEELMKICGFVNYQQVIIKGFIMISGQKPA